jgi:serine/threonine protein kinase
VKPQNVLVREDGAKVTDFGIARADDLDLEGESTATGTVLGTGDYISPEQAHGERGTEQSDVYSLGVLLYELLTGHVPYPADTAVAAAARHATDPIPDVLSERPDVPVRLAAAVGRAMAKDPAQRFVSMDGFLAELIACRSEAPPPDAAQTMILPDGVPLARPAQRASSRRRPRILLVALVVLLLLALVGAGAYYLSTRGHKSAGDGGPNSASASNVHLRATNAYDPPPGDGREGDNSLANATDGSTATSWETERYTTASFGNLKQGVGLVLDAGKPVRLGSLTIQSPTPGFTAEIKTGSSPQGPFPNVVSSPETVGDRTTFTLHVPSGHRYYLIWITKLAQFDTADASKPFAAKISEATGS